MAAIPGDVLILGNPHATNLINSEKSMKKIWPLVRSVAVNGASQFLRDEI